MKNLKHTVFLWFLLLGMWIILNGSFTPLILTSGAIISLVLTLLMRGETNLLGDLHWGPQALWAMIAYIFVFGWEIILANIDVAKRVLQPTVDINPGIVKIKTKLKTDLAKLVLANSITLTPGTLTVDVIGDELYIHWIDVKTQDVQKATEEIAATFEKYLEVICG